MYIEVGLVEPRVELCEGLLLVGDVVVDVDRQVLQLLDALHQFLLLPLVVLLQFLHHQIV